MSRVLCRHAGHVSGSDATQRQERQVDVQQVDAEVTQQRERTQADVEEWLRRWVTRRRYVELASDETAATEVSCKVYKRAQLATRNDNQLHRARFSDLHKFPQIKPVPSHHLGHHDEVHTAMQKSGCQHLAGVPTSLVNMCLVLRCWGTNALCLRLRPLFVQALIVKQTIWEAGDEVGLCIVSFPSLGEAVSECEPEW